MHPRTQKTVDELARADWFSAVGHQVDGPVIVVRSWEEAMQCCASTEWDDLLLEAANRYREAVLARSPERFEEWNDIVLRIKPVVVPLVQQKIAATVARHHLPKVFEDTAQWDILHVCMEAEYADVYPPGFFASQAFWYVHGRFPCGWQGQFPDGKLVIY